MTLFNGMFDKLTTLAELGSGDGCTASASQLQFEEKMIIEKPR